MEFDMDRIGRNIAERRKAKNITQMALADELNISFQAVSNWERGQTMPDVAKLPELAKILGCTIDELLGNERSADIVRHVVEDKPLEDGLSVEEFSAIAPALEPRKTEKIFAEEIKEKARWDYQKIMGIAPFMSSDMLGEIVRDAAEDGAPLSDLAGLAPFLDRKTLGELSMKALENGEEIEKISALAPFLGREELGRLLQAALDRGQTIENISGLAPFVDQKTLGELCRRALDNGEEIENIGGLAPFLSREDLSRLVRQAMDRGQSIGEIGGLAPFLDSATLSDLAAVHLEKGGSPDEVMAFAPFMDRDGLENIIRQAFRRPQPPRE